MPYPQPQQPQTFASMQQAGVARPPSPSFAPQPPIRPRAPRAPQPEVPQATQQGVSMDAHPAPTMSAQYAGGDTAQTPQPPPHQPRQVGGTVMDPRSAPIEGWNPPPQQQGQPRQPWQPGTNPFDLGQTVIGNYQNYQPFGGFNQQFQSGPQIHAPQGQPNAPQAYGYNAAPGAQNSNFNVDRYSAITAPQGQYTGSFNPGQNSLYQGATNLSQQQLQTPNRYDTPQAQDIYNMLNTQLGVDMGAQKQQINEDMARRGLFYSTIAGGRLGDLATRQAEQQRGFATDIAREAAMANSGDISSAIGNALGIGGQQYGENLQTFDANMGAAGQNFQQDLASRAFAGDQQAQQVLNSLQQGQFGLQQNAQNYGQNLQSYGANLAGQQQSYNQQSNTAGQQNQFINDNLNRQLQTGQYNQGLNQSQFDNSLSAYGANQGTNAQNFAQQQQNLNNIFGYGQQQFNNQLSTAQFNQGQDNTLQQLLMQLLGLT